jgi:hypothetical protein
MRTANVYFAFELTMECALIRKKINRNRIALDSSVANPDDF